MPNLEIWEPLATAVRCRDGVLSTSIEDASEMVQLSYLAYSSRSLGTSTPARRLLPHLTSALLNLSTGLKVTGPVG